MGTFYTLGIIRQFETTADKGPVNRWGREHRSLTREEWIKALRERIDPYIYHLELQEDGSMHGFLKNEIFQQNINGFYDVLREILGERRNTNIDHYAEFTCNNKKGIHDDSDDSNGYSIEGAHPIHIINKDGLGIKIKYDFIMLMLEGKVLVEEFNTDPVLINYLFRNSNINNPLKGAVTSQVVE
ncbi:hypothetical protein [Metabacillus schmidteae]|uniref:hypothetical protein n=1 Tax=Metabacillus schmidteae TaxID=2730405 RepID=UPI001589AB52|nr:hypothetical protein [Metabacillus schmidteae]